MKAYHFIKYTDSTSLDKLIEGTDQNTVLCFDLEDSIQDCLFPENTSLLKAKYRDHFKKMIKGCSMDPSELSIGVRINTTDSEEYLLDIKLLTELKAVATIFLPKTDDVNQVLNLQKDLLKCGIHYQELILVVETKQGMKGIKEILSYNLPKIGGVALGHCDYNQDCQNFPFFHQNSREYWTWIGKLFDYVSPFNIRLINSPFLELNNTEYFKHILGLVTSIAGRNAGQITLTQEQTSICNSFPEKVDNADLPSLKNRLDMRVPVCYAEEFIQSFQKKTHQKGFAVTDDRTILSPQEYFSSINFLGKRHFPELNFTFVGGCFPVQGNILFENIFHQKLKQKAENFGNLKFNVNIIRYEQFSTCTSKISKYRENHPIDILTFSIRPEPFLRMVKLHYVFFDPSIGRKNWTWNLPILKRNTTEKHDVLHLDGRFIPKEPKNRSFLRKALIDLNYLFGALLGNERYAMKKYLELVNEVNKFCKKTNSTLLVLGPPIRTNTPLEKILSKRLERFMKKSIPIAMTNFIGGSDRIKNGKSLFKKNGIYANEEYHALIADRIMEKISSNLVQIIDNHEVLVQEKKEKGHVMNS